MTREQIEAFAKELATVCVKHRIALRQGDFFYDRHSVFDGFSFEDTVVGRFEMIEMSEGEDVLDEENVNVRVQEKDSSLLT